MAWDVTDFIAAVVLSGVLFTAAGALVAVAVKHPFQVFAAIVTLGTVVTVVNILTGNPPPHM